MPTLVETKDDHVITPVHWKLVVGCLVHEGAAIIDNKKDAPNGQVTLVKKGSTIKVIECQNS